MSEAFPGDLPGVSSGAWLPSVGKRLQSMGVKSATLSIVVVGFTSRRVFTAQIIKSGPIPKHIAIIMDGNRRFARKANIECGKGHALGFEKLRETLEWCLDVGVEVVTVYAFSIENFKRSQSEVDGLLQLAKEKFLKLLEKSDLIEKHQVCVRILGDTTMLPTDLQGVIAKVVHTSRLNKRATLNVCFAYTSRHEIFHATSLIDSGIKAGLLKQSRSDMSERLVEQCLFTHDSPPPELLIRTSGEVRLSDFLLWQVLWPEFSFWHFFACLLRYQWNHAELAAARGCHAMMLDLQDRDADIAAAKCQGCVTTEELTQRVKKIKTERDLRISVFLTKTREAAAAECAKLALSSA